MQHLLFTNQYAAGKAFPHHQRQPFFSNQVIQKIARGTNPMTCSSKEAFLDQQMLFNKFIDKIMKTSLSKLIPRELLQTGKGAISETVYYGSL